MDNWYVDQLSEFDEGEWLIRRINPRFCVWNELNPDGYPRITSQATQFYTESMASNIGYPGPAMSVILRSRVEDVAALPDRYRPDGLAQIPIAVVRSLGGLGAQFWPTPDEPAHAVIFRTDKGRDLSRSTKKRLVEHLGQNWISPPSRP